MRKHIFSLILIAVSIVSWLITLPYLPSDIALHWNLSGGVDRYSSKISTMLIMVSLLIFIYIMPIILPKIDPKKDNYKLFSRHYNVITNVLLFIFFILNFLVIFNGLGYSIPMSSLAPFIIGALFIVIGNFLQTIRTNFFIGIRTPWTLCSDEVWRKTHRFGAKVMVIVGFVIMLTTFISAGWREIIILISIIISFGLPVIYSYWLFKKVKV